MSIYIIRSAPLGDNTKQTNKQRILVKFSHIYRKQPSGPSGGATIKPPGAVKFGVGAEL